MIGLRFHERCRDNCSTLNLTVLFREFGGNISALHPLRLSGDSLLNSPNTEYRKRCS